jgi:hypothetical protein
MSSVANISFESGTIGVPTPEWDDFCREHQIKHSPQTVDGDVYCAGEVSAYLSP